MSHGAPVENAAKERCRLGLKHRMFSRINTLKLVFHFTDGQNEIERRQVAYEATSRTETRSSENFVLMLIKPRTSDYQSAFVFSKLCCFAVGCLVCSTLLLFSNLNLLNFWTQMIDFTVNYF